jgi:hypothetical protein
MDYNSTTTFGSAVSSIAGGINTVINAFNSVTGGSVGNLSTSYTPSGSIMLPIPKKLNDVQTVLWEQISATQLAAGIVNNATGTAGQVVGAGASVVGPGVGMTLNPMLFMTFKSPTFKEHTLNWTLAPNNEAESNTIRDIVNFFKFKMLPAEAGVLYKYPDICFVQIHPSSQFTFKFKPCAVTSVQVDFTGAGGPSFFRNGAPTVVNLSVQLKEIELWTKNNYTS